MKPFIGTKTLNAKPMTLGAYNELRGWDIPANEDPEAPGYLVEYADGGKPNHPDFAGYISWSPVDVFERSYRPTTAMTFGDALVMANAGKRIAREGWNGKGQYVYQAILTMETEPVFIIRNAQGKLQPGWLPSQGDMLAEDWTEVP